ncbi:hypothetical protein ALP8811_02008 [Aliiroseovarius pelagivivens]|uniref:Uncharacterized protein n=1 Tax=Aliiroseovarius pelagivivens TaxID=1639690 RepID=A0A2R8ALW6_9RHOB|nr:hypothetical protein [Aliiroseovarius pelagivivens]SPF76990.1 hypothetical protein ALP8811_02008 [Aliiroseovarius pelagivivens]
MNVDDPALRSNAVTLLHIGAPRCADLRTWTERNTGALGSGLGIPTLDDPKGDGFFRLDHIGHVNAPVVMCALSAFHLGLTVLGIQHGEGALPAAAEILVEV